MQLMRQVSQVAQGPLMRQVSQVAQGTVMAVGIAAGGGW